MEETTSIKIGTIENSSVSLTYVFSLALNLLFYVGGYVYFYRDNISSLLSKRIFS